MLLDKTEEGDKHLDFIEQHGKEFKKRLDALLQI
jgi:hypothetical protein